MKKENVYIQEKRCEGKEMEGKGKEGKWRGEKRRGENTGKETKEEQNTLSHKMFGSLHYLKHFFNAFTKLLPQLIITNVPFLQSSVTMVTTQSI